MPGDRRGRQEAPLRPWSSSLGRPWTRLFREEIVRGQGRRLSVPGQPAARWVGGGRLPSPYRHWPALAPQWPEASCPLP